MKHHTIIVILLSIALFCISCSDTKPLPLREKFPLFYKSTLDFDTARARIGLPLISDKLKLKWWTTECYTEYFAYCMDFEATDTLIRPRFHLKNIITDTIGICKERNFFIGPNYEELSISYCYKEYYDFKTLGFWYTFKNNGYKRHEITKNQADSILEKWSLKIP